MFAVRTTLANSPKNFPLFRPDKESVSSEKSGRGLIRMSRPAVAIPEKLFFKIGEVCELAGVQAHVLRYWESEFPMLAPQKNRAGQRVYRKRDVEMALRIKELLYEDQYTIAGAKKRLANDLRGGGKLKVVGVDDEGHVEHAPVEYADSEPFPTETPTYTSTVAPRTAEERQGLKQLAAELRELLSLLEQQETSRKS
jgi:DNA-binding transcriptional MerR regulator